MPSPEKFDENKPVRGIPEPPAAKPVVDPVDPPAVVETEVEQPDEAPAEITVRLAKDRQNRGPVTLSIAGLPKPIELEGSKSVKVPAMFAESLRLAPAVEIVEEA